MNWPERVWIYSPVRVFFQKREVRKWLATAPPKPDGIALEIGCGLGRGARLLIEMMGFNRIIAFDLETKLVRWAKRISPSKYKESINFYAGDAQDLPFKDAVFDSVVNFGIIHHVLDWRRAIRETSRCLKPNGVFYFEEIYPPLYANPLFKAILRHPIEDRFYEQDFLNVLEANGLVLAKGVRTGSRFGIVGAAIKTMK